MAGAVSASFDTLFESECCDNDALFRKYVFDHTNNEPLTDMICKLNTPGGLEPETPEERDMTPDELFAFRLYAMIPAMDLVSDLCHIRDLIYGDGSRTLDVDPSYQDATVEDEARPKAQTIAWFQAVKPQGPDLTDQMQGIRERMHKLKFNPMQAIMDDRYENLSELDKLALTPVEQSPYYTRF